MIINDLNVSDTIISELSLDVTTKIKDIDEKYGDIFQIRYGKDYFVVGFIHNNNFIGIERFKYIDLSSLTDNPDREIYVMYNNVKRELK